MKVERLGRGIDADSEIGLCAPAVRRILHKQKVWRGGRVVAGE